MIGLMSADLVAQGDSLLERAVGYTLGVIHTVTSELFSQPTPCSAWELRALLGHLNDSMAILHEGVATGTVGPVPAEEEVLAADPRTVFRHRASHLLDALCGMRAPGRTIAIIDRSLTGGMTAGTGAIEVAVHGWDISRACRQPSQIPPLLATDLLELSRLVVTAENRYPFFAAPRTMPSGADPSDLLVAFLGRNPFW